ncbi:hypothetical protein ACVDFE_02500 [Lentzea chajnantorensis]
MGVKVLWSRRIVAAASVLAATGALTLAGAGTAAAADTLRYSVCISKGSSARAQIVFLGSHGASGEAAPGYCASVDKGRGLLFKVRTRTLSGQWKEDGKFYSSADKHPCVTAWSRNGGTDTAYGISYFSSPNSLCG